MPTLDQLSQGSRAHVSCMRAIGPIAQRLLEMGLVPGAMIRRIGSAPLGDPLEFEVEDYRLSLRRAEAALVEVELD